jgi:tRNA pseudouridine13 synthase
VEDPVFHDLARAIDPPAVTAALPGIGGILRARPEDFCVKELPSYAPDGRENAHLLLTMRKTGMSTEAALHEVARAVGVPRAAFGHAGLKDQDAVTLQWISAPAEAKAALERFEHPSMELGALLPHGNKLRRGHLKGNQFEIVVRDPPAGIEEAIARCRAKIAALREGGGLHNFYGPQRFGKGGVNARNGLAAIRAGVRRRRGDLVVSAGQSALFNLYLLVRHSRGLLRRALAGDILKKTTTGGLFACTDPEVDQARMEAGELVVTGPIFGGRMRCPPSDTPAASLEEETLQRAGMPAAAISNLGRRAPGSRRPVLVQLDDVQVRAAPAIPDAGLAAGVCVTVTLPPGTYAVVLCRELQEGH